MPYYLCVNGSINTDGTDLLDIRFSEGEECVDYFEQCCDVGGVAKEVIPGYIPEPIKPGPGGEVVIPPPNPIHNGNQGGIGPGTGGTTTGGLTTNPGQGGLISEGQSCGFRNADGVGFRITGNTEGESEYGEFPWMVAILKEELAAEQVLNVYQCGGSLIHPSVVLTGLFFLPLAYRVNGFIEKNIFSRSLRAGQESVSIEGACR